MNEKQFIKQILKIKGYKATLEALSEEEKSTKNTKKINYFVDLIQSTIQSCDLDALSKLWSEYEVSYFKYLDFDKQRNADLFKSDIFKAYLIECHKNKRTDKINSFFISFSKLRLNIKNDWSDWFDFPFVKSVQDHQIFGIYYTKSWFDNLFLSLFNFFMQVMRNTMTTESRLERFFNIDMGLDQCANELMNNEVDVVRKQYNLPDSTENRRQFIDQLMSSLHYKSRSLHDVTELLCDFRLISENKQLEVKRMSGNNKPRGLGVFIQNKSKATSPTNLRKMKTIFHVNVDNIESRENLERIDESINSDSNIVSQDLQAPLKEDNDSNSSSNSTVIINFPISPLPEQGKLPTDSFGIRNLSNKISQRIFKPKVVVEAPKPILYHEHFSMVTHVKFTRMPSPTWASLDVGGTFKIWSTNDVQKAFCTLSFKHTIHSFDWVSCTTDMVLLGTKYGSVKLYDLTSDKVTNEMIIDSVHPRVNIVQSFDSDAKFVCESLDHSRSTISRANLPQGVISLCDAENWSLIRENMMSLDSQFTVNCISCWSNMVATGCSNGCLKLLDVRVSGTTPVTSISVFDNEEVINIIRTCESKWPINLLDSNVLTCFGSKSHVKLLDIRKPVDSFRQDPWSLNNLTLPLSWSGRPNGGEQIIYIPRSNLISEASLGNDVLFSAAGGGINVHKMTSSSLSEPTFVNCGHNSPVICMDSSPVDLNDRSSAMVLTGTMEGTISAMKISNKT